MIPGRKASVRRRSHTKRSVAARSKPQPKNGTLSGRTAMDKIWDQFVENVLEALREALGATPLDETAAIVKRKTYEFVRRHYRRPKEVERAIRRYRREIEEGNDSEGDRKRSRAIRKPYKGNEFHWVLLGLRSAFSIETDISIELSPVAVSRFAAQLNYARRHRVPSQYLIGFIYQSGSTESICKKANDQGIYEPWFKHLKNAAVYYSDYVSIALDVTAVGDDAGVVLPEDVLLRLGLKIGDSLYFSEAPDGLRVTKSSFDFVHKMALAETVMQDDRNMLHLLG